MRFNPPTISALIGFLALASGHVWAATIITPGATDNTIAFEAEIGVIDNAFGTPGIGWEVDVATAPSSPSGGSYVTNTEDTTGGAPTNLITYTIDFQKAGTYTLWYRVAYTTDDFEDARDATGNNDSFYYENGTIDAASTFRERNSIPVSTSAWTWVQGVQNDITLGSAGQNDWQIAGREDGFIIDRFALVHSDESATVNAAFLDGLANTATIPEPSAALLIGLGGMSLLLRRRRA